MRSGENTAGDGNIHLCAGTDGGWGRWAASRTRRRLRLSEIPLPTVIAAVLYSFPVVFAMERGNCDLLTVPLILCALVLLRRKSSLAQIAAGGSWPSHRGLKCTLVCWAWGWPACAVGRP